MSVPRYLPKDELSDKNKDFLKSWGVNNQGIFLDGGDQFKDVYIWSGRFDYGETITIVADSIASKSMKDSKLYIGVVKEDDLLGAQNNGLNPLEVHADAAVQPAIGIIGAIALLTSLKGLPKS